MFHPRHFLARTAGLLTVLLLATTATLAQTAPDTTVLRGNDWRHALAVVAQLQALDRGFGKATADFEQRSPDGYLLDDLNQTYDGNAKWAEIYPALKARENDGGTVADIRALAGNLAPNAAREIGKYLAARNAADTPAANNEAAAPDADLTDAPPATEPLPNEAPQPDNAHGNGTPLALYLLLLFALLLAIAALAAALLMHRQLRQQKAFTDQRLQEIADSMGRFAEEASERVNRLNHRIANMENARHLTEPRPVSVERQRQTRKDNTPKQEQVIYLSKPDDDDNFTRPSANFELGNSIYRLTTTDGIHGTFSVVDHRDVHRFALMMPTENLTRACSGNAIQMAAGMTRIITDRPGEALFENGRWHVVVKAIIHYEA